MKNLRKVVWTKGMFLTPQHFQSQEHFFSDVLQHRFANSFFANWGVVELAVDLATLTNGHMAFVACRGILPDGLPFEMPAVDELPAGRTIAEHFRPADAFLDVYLAIPESRTAGKDVSYFQSTSSDQPLPIASTRYVAENLDVMDENTGDEKKTVQVGRKNFRILFGDEILDGHTTMRLARIVRDRKNQFVLDTEFIAPCLEISASDYLMSLLKRQAELLRTKSAMLGAGRRQKGSDLADFSTTDVATFWLLHTVNSCLPEWLHIWKIRRGHPEHLYAAMLRLAGALSTFAISDSTPDLPDYDHDGLGRCFTELDARIRTLLDTVIPAKCISIPLRFDASRSIWVGNIENERHLQNTQFFLAVSSRLSLPELVDRVPKLAKIASPEQIEPLITYALHAVGLFHTPAPPSAISVRLDNQYFRLDQRDQLWTGIVQSRSIGVYVPNEITDYKIEMLVVLS